MDYGFDRVMDRRNTNCAKYDLVQRYGYPEDVLPMWVADMDFQAPPCVRQALHQAVDQGIFGYSFLPDRYFNALQSWFSRRFQWQIQKDWVVTTPGVVTALSAAVCATTQAGDRVLVQPPVYYPFYQVIRENGRVCVESPLVYENGRYRVDFQDFERKITENQVKLFILCSPHNPVGRVWTARELRQMGEICRKHGVKVVADEIHCDFAFPEHPHTPLAVACPELAEDVMICTAPSKTFNLAGLQVSNILIPGQALRDRFQKEMKRFRFSEPNCLGMIACIAAYEQGEDWLMECKAYMRQNLSYLRTFLQEKLPRIRLVEPEGTYLAWLDCSGLGLSKEELDDLMLRKAGLWLDSGSLFGSMAEQFQRMVLACPRQVVEQAMERLEAAISG